MADKAKAPDDDANSTSSDPLPLRDPGKAYHYTGHLLAQLTPQARLLRKMWQASNEKIEEVMGKLPLPVDDASESDDLEPNFPDGKNPLLVPEGYNSDGSVNQRPREERRKKQQKESKKRYKKKPSRL